MKYEFVDDYVIIREHYNRIAIYEYNNDSELDFLTEDSEKVIILLENLMSMMDKHECDYIDLGTYEGTDEDGDYTGEYYWNDDYVMDNEYINPYFSPDNGFYGNCIYRDDIPNIIEALKEYLCPSSLDRIDNLTLKSILRLKRNLVK
jgi:hypothetical protein